MPTIVIPAFSGEVPKTTPRLLENTQAAIAINCDLERGHLAPLRGPGFVERLPQSSKTIFKHPQDGWLGWDKPVNVVMAGVHDVIGEDPLGRIYITGDRPYPTQYLAGGEIRRLGIPRPQDAPTVTIEPGASERTVRCYAFGTNDKSFLPPRYGIGDAPNFGNVACYAFCTDTPDPRPACHGHGPGLNEIEEYNLAARIAPFARVRMEFSMQTARLITDCGIDRTSSYCYTWVQTLAGGRIQQESAPSPPSRSTEVYAGDGVRISGFVIPNLPEANITHIRLYRTLSGNETSEFHFLAELALPVAQHIDTKIDRDVSLELLRTTTWDPIPDDAKGLILTESGIYAAFRGNELLLSEPHYAYAFPADYRLTMEDRIVALGHTEDTIMVLTEGRPYLVSGEEPGKMRVMRLPVEQACVAARSVDLVPGGVIYASPDGLMIYSASDKGLATGQTFTRDQWRRLDLENFMGVMLDGQYLGFFAGTNRGIIFTPGQKEIVRVLLPDGMKVVGIYHHSVDDCVYLSIDGKDGSHAVWEWKAGEAMDYLWRSKPFFTSRLVAMRAIRVEGDQTPGNRARVYLYGPVTTRPREILKLTDTKTKRATTTRAEKLWTIELRGKSRIFEARLGSSVEALEYGA